MRKLYRLLLKLYPARFREEFSAPLERQFAEEYGEIEGAGARVWFWLRTIADLAVTVPAEFAREVRQDLIYATRVYRKRSLATLLALSALALAIGATTGVFSVVNALLIRSLPFQQPERLVQAKGMLVSAFNGRSEYLGWPASHDYLESIAGYSPTQVNLGVGGQTTRVQAAEVSANFFALLGSDAAFGRTFTPEEDVPGHDGVAVIGHALWEQAFGGDPRVLGATIYLNGTAATVIGVAQPTLDFPAKTAVWIPTAFDYEHLSHAGVSFALTIGRVKRGVAVAQASAIYRADTLRDRKNPPRPGEEQPELAPLQDQLAGPVRQASLVLLGLVAFVLLIACANVAHLLLARATERRQEMTIRNALGASRARLVQQLITESMLLTLLAAGAGLLVARWATRVAAAAQPAQLAIQQYSVLDWRVLGFAAALAGLTGLLFGVLPAWLMGQDGLRARASGQSTGAGRMRIALLAMQGALTVVLVAGSLTMGRSFLRILGKDLGFRTANLVTLNVSLAGTHWDSEKRQAEYYDDAVARLRAVPGVVSAAAVGYLPLMELSYGAGEVKLDASHAVRPTLWNAVSPDYFRTMGTRVVEGRDFTANDRNAAELTAIVDDEFARRLGVGPHIVGKRLTVRYSPTLERTFTLVGVVQAEQIFGPGAKAYPQMFLPLGHSGFATLVAHVNGSVDPYLAICRDTVQRLDPQVPVYDVKTLDERLRDRLARPRFYTTAVLFFGGFALLLSVVGIYGVATYSIAQRTREIGLRIAVGASPGGLRGMLLRQSLTPLACGVLAGVAGAASLGRYLQHLMSQAETTGAATCAAAALLLGIVAALAVWTATGRIIRMDPTAALRSE